MIAHGTPDELKARTGAQSLAVRPADESDLPTVVSIIRGLTDVEPELTGQLVTAHVTDPAVLPAAVRRLDDAGVGNGAEPPPKRATRRPHLVTKRTTSASARLASGHGH